MAITGTRLRCSTDQTKSMNVTLGTTVTQGQMAKINDTVGFYVEAGDSGDLVAFVYQADKVIVPCASVTSGSFTQGSKVYFDAADAEVNESASGNTLCGVVLETPTTGVEEVEIELDGTLGITS